MKFTCKAYIIERKTAAPAVCLLRGGFTLLELMVVIVIIGILASLAYSSLIDVIFTNRAKETAQAMRTFAETSLMEAKRQGYVVKFELVGGNMEATFGELKDNGEMEIKSSKKQPLSDGFSKGGSELTGLGVNNEFDDITSQQLIGVSGIIDEGAFVACGTKRGFCGAIVKTLDKNSFQAWIKKGSGTSWREI
jgi:prepilin-type N-terminal cleavage/methylation domain-containing protein